MGLLLLERHLIWSGPNAEGGISFYYYYDAITWILGALALTAVTWLLVNRYLRLRALRRRPRRRNHRLLRRVVRIKSELSRRFLPLGVSNNIHAVGIGMLAGNPEQYCIQVFVNDAGRELWHGSGAAALPGDYRGIPLVLIEMPAAGFLVAENPGLPIRERQEVIIGGISGANTNLTGASGTIGYFCTRKSRFSRLKETHLLSNSHVFADLQRATVAEDDLIMQPSPGEPGSNRPIGTLVNFSALKFEGDVTEPNHIDAAIAKLWASHQHKPLLPFIGAVKGYVAKKDITLGESARKFGRTTGYTEGRVFSIYLDLWIRYDRTRQSAFFENQLLVEPAAPAFQKFVAKGDSGSLLVDGNQHAIGLIFGGMSEAPETAQALPNPGATNTAQRIEGYGVANPITDVLEQLKIELLLNPEG
ncbi:MAG TPA: hypothetical protein VJP89_22435 [Pyrinomonadaceae bacterium]|nr:hypothetical protein [Pyrinomonadaceae bacterium]